jgi:molybdopterin synthase sulfur carrier subunit
LKVLFYGRLADALGRELEFPAQVTGTVATLRQALIEAHPSARDALSDKRTRACINDALVPDDHVLEPPDCVEFLPPVSGG